MFIFESDILIRYLYYYIYFLIVFHLKSIVTTCSFTILTNYKSCPPCLMLSSWRMSGDTISTETFHWTTWHWLSELIVSQGTQTKVKVPCSKVNDKIRLRHVWHKRTFYGICTELARIRQVTTDDYELPVFCGRLRD